jgi:hypothetical protein
MMSLDLVVVLVLVDARLQIYRLPDIPSHLPTTILIFDSIENAVYTAVRVCRFMYRNYTRQLPEPKALLLVFFEGLPHLAMPIEYCQ